MILNHIYYEISAGIASIECPMCTYYKQILIITLYGHAKLNSSFSLRSYVTERLLINSKT